MTDRDFKLLVREYFQHQTKIYKGIRADLEWFVKKDALEQRILSELEAFTEREQQELPFKEKEI